MKKKYCFYHPALWWWIGEGKTKTGYEINFSKFIYEFKLLRSLAEIKSAILVLEASSLKLEKKVLED